MLLASSTSKRIYSINILTTKSLFSLVWQTTYVFRHLYRSWTVHIINRKMFFPRKDTTNPTVINIRLWPCFRHHIRQHLFLEMFPKFEKWNSPNSLSLSFLLKSYGMERVDIYVRSTIKNYLDITDRILLYGEKFYFSSCEFSTFHYLFKLII